MVESRIEQWKAGHSDWVVRARAPIGRVDAGGFVGFGGVRILETGVWNLGYRLAPEAWGRGLATELSEAAMAAAHDVAPQIPVTGLVLTNNPASIRILERVGMTMAWQGWTTVTDEPGVERQLWADRPLPAAVLNTLIESERRG